MGWLMAVTVLAVTIAGTCVWKMYRLKRDIYHFEDQMENAFDQILAGAEMKNEEEEEDTLWGKFGEKLRRVHHIWWKKEEENVRKKEQMKELISDISHQTKTPIANMKLYLELLQEENLSEQGKEFLSNLEGQTEKLDFLLQSMVKMSRLEAGSITIKSSRQSLYKTLRKAVEEIVPAAAKKEMALFVDCPENLLVKHDKKWTEEAIFNVLDNAVKYTDPGGRIRITVIKQEIFTKIEVSDTGKGIPVERQAQIFTRFYREPEVHDKNGVGIGLFLARKIMELQNGYIEVHSQMGVGSDFALYLPND